MAFVTARAQFRRVRPPQGWARTCVLVGLLIGLLGMHGLAPGGTPAHSGGGHHPHAAAMAHTQLTALDDEFVCDGDSGDGGHAQHADPACASAAVGGGPALAAPLPDPVGAAVPAGTSHRSLTTSPEDGRAPSSLAELQLLRI
ncbi:DUF6153 family protein [Streptomyces dysideae]|uniref:DUF6153 family protein n=1 Tax=Streptomyces dysideae TaxID=909626 RepID=UPI000A59BACD|nr:DUF6153 family protein [Streptomyces dysideae]